MTSLFVGNLPVSATERSIRSLFEQYGNVDKVSVVYEKDSGRPRGFCFVVMADDDADQAIHHLNHFEMEGRLLRVNKAHDATE